ncbi:E3 ubiquitin-protein ligase MARCH5 isoform X1 [Phasianus colchicus]|uniref:E3 ubiquitin-protein ligase MARCH5 isoform X1 n=1 Tax=Phasianus colchicus TaxID=9054 RepID=UPI00129E7AE6|nr:E3 ubiquitin-protein ligase MARCH5 isoform X1 [Phasianus colchicus]
MRCPAGPLSPRRRRDYTSRRARPSRPPPGRRRAGKRAGTGVAVALGLYLTEAPPPFISAPRRLGPRRACVAPSARRVPPAEGGAWRGAAPLSPGVTRGSPRAGPLCQAAGPRLGPRLPPSEPCRSRRAWRCRRPWTGPVVYVLDLADRLISKACPFAAAGIMVGSIYWTAVTYGAVTVMQVVGHKEGLDVMERADPLFLLIGLPTIPVMLILGKMIRWEDYVLRLWRKYSNKLQILNSIFPGIGCPVPRIPAEANPLADHVSATRILCGALVFPTIATIVGKLMFSSVNSNLQRTILGGIAFVAIKGAFKVYFKQQQYLRQAHRKILNYPEQEGA